MTFRPQAWVEPGVIDAAVLRRNAQDRFADYGVKTLIHDHAYRAACNDECKEWPVSE